MSFTRVHSSILAIALVLAVGAPSNAAYDLAISDASGVAGSTVVLDLTISGDMELDALNPGISVTPVGVVAPETDITMIDTIGISSIWDTAAQPMAFSTAPIPAALTKHNANIMGSDVNAIGNGLAFQVQVAIPAGASVGQMYLVDIDAKSVTGATLTEGFNGSDAIALNFIDMGNGPGIGKITVSAVPEPSSFVLLGLVGCIAVGFRRFKKARNQE